jgi:hypothetical protein
MIFEIFHLMSQIKLPQFLIWNMRPQNIISENRLFSTKIGF